MGNLNEHDILFLSSAHFQELRQLLEVAYGFQILQSEPVRYISFTSRKAILTTDKGIFFLKEKPIYCSDEESLDRSTRVQHFLSEKLSLVPKIRHTLDGAASVTYKGRKYVLTDYVPGRVYNGSVGDIQHGIEALCALHTAIKDMPLSSSDVPVDSDVYRGFLPLIESSLRTEEEQAVWRQVKVLISELMAEYSVQNPHQYEMSHGDFSLFNLLFDDTKVLAVNDFDNVGKLPRVHDFAEYLVSSTLVHYLGPLTNLQYPVFLAPEKIRWNQILKGYDQTPIFSEEEWKVFPVVVKMVWLEILLLAVIKNDYSLLDLAPAISLMQNGEVEQWIEAGKGHKRLYLWDFHDTLETGTLFVITEIANCLLEEHGASKRYTPQELAAVPSFSWNTFFQMHFPEKSAEEVARISEEAYDFDRFAYLTQKFSVARDQALDVLKAIQASGGTNIVLSHSRNDRLKMYIDQIGATPFLAASYGVDDGTVTSKADVLMKKTIVAKRLMQEGGYDEVYAIGDSESDYNVARAIQATKFFWISTPEQHTRRRADFGESLPSSVYFIEELKQILAHL